MSVKKLAECYKNSLQLEIGNNCRSIAFPCISTGIYKFPPDEAAHVAVQTVVNFLSKSIEIDEVALVCFDEVDF
jgi:O-acetyl-ADP-ribose deacetylase